MNDSGMRMVRWIVALFVVVAMLASAGSIAAQDDEDCLPEEAAALLDPDRDGVITTLELESFVEFLGTIDPAEYPGDLEADIDEIEGFIEWMYGSDMPSITYVLCDVPDPTVPPEETPEPTTAPEVTPEPTSPPQVTPEPTTRPYVEPQPTVAPPPDDTWQEPEEVTLAAPVEEAAPVVAEVQPAVVSLPNTGAGVAGPVLMTPAVILAAASAVLALLSGALRLRRHPQ